MSVCADHPGTPRTGGGGASSARAEPWTSLSRCTFVFDMHVLFYGRDYFKTLWGWFDIVFVSVTVLYCFAMMAFQGSP